MFLKIFTFFLPWSLRRRALNKWFGFEIHPAARIGMSWIFPGKLVMKAGASINHFTLAIPLDLIEMGEQSGIGRGKWITGLSTKSDAAFFKHQPNRKAVLRMGEASNITK